MSDRKLVEQLTNLKAERAGGTPDAAWVVSTRDTLLMQVKNTVGEGAPAKNTFGDLFGLVRLVMPENLTRLAMVPAMMLLLVVGANFGSSAVVAAAKDTLPGEALYAVKLAAEKMALRFATRETKADRRLEIAGRRLEEMTRLAASTAEGKDEKIAGVAALFSQSMTDLRADMAKLQASGDAEASVKVALRVDAAADEYLKIFQRNGLAERPNLRFAVLSLDQASVGALELLVNSHDNSPDALPEARLSSAVGKTIDTFAAHVATADGPENLKAKEAVDEAKLLLSNGDFKAAVRKVAESAELISSATTTSVTSASTTEE